MVMLHTEPWEVSGSDPQWDGLYKRFGGAWADEPAYMGRSYSRVLAIGRCVAAVGGSGLRERYSADYVTVCYHGVAVLMIVRWAMSGNIMGVSWGHSWDAAMEAFDYELWRES